jgi:RNA polymerase sigma factor (sigma-70 family)
MRAIPSKEETAQMLRERQIEKILARLDEREQAIIINRFGLDRRQEPKTLKEVGSQLGVTKERIRQIEARALGKLRWRPLKSASRSRINPILLAEQFPRIG